MESISKIDDDETQIDEYKGKSESISSSPSGGDLGLILMGDLNARVDINKLMSLGDDLIGVLNNKKDGESLMQSVEGEKTLCVATQSDDQEVQASLEEYHRRISAYKEKIDETRSGTVADDEIELDKFQRENMLWEELRVIHEELDGLERKRISIEERKEIVKKREKDLLRAQNLLSMCASVTNIIPHLDDQDMISGLVVDRNKKGGKKFEFETSLSPFEVSNRLWKIADNGC